MSFYIGVVVSQFNREFTEKLEQAALQLLEERKVRVEVLRVPGAFELPLAAKLLIETKGVDGVVALGAVIRGETDHYDYVCHAAETGCLAVSLESRKPVGFGVLTVDTEQQAWDRCGGSHGNKGRDTAEAVLEMCTLSKALT